MAEPFDLGSWILVQGLTLIKSCPSLMVKVIGQRSRSPGCISNGMCHIYLFSHDTWCDIMSRRNISWLHDITVWRHDVRLSVLECLWGKNTDKEGKMWEGRQHTSVLIYAILVSVSLHKYAGVCEVSDGEDCHSGWDQGEQSCGRFKEWSIQIWRHSYWPAEVCRIENSKNVCQWRRHYRLIKVTCPSNYIMIDDE